jgi:ribonuclease HI
VQPPKLTQQSNLDPSQGIAIFSDGSSWTGDRSGGWAWLAIDAFDGELESCGFASDTTNNRMEMTAWIEGLTSIYDLFGAIDVLMYSDSEYVGLGAMDRNRNRNKNADLWTRLDGAVDLHSYVEFVHVRGHSNHPYNERVDKMAGLARREKKSNHTAPHS